MAVNWESVNALTRDLIIPKVFDQIFSSNPLFFLLDGKGVKERGGRKIKVPVQYAKTGATGSYKGFDLLSTTKNEKFTDPELDWKQAYASIVISGLEEIINDGSQAVVDLLEQETTNAKLSIQDVLGTALYGDGTGNSSKDIDGLKAAVDDGTNTATYAGILRTTYTWWKSIYTSWSATPVSLYAFQSVFGDVTDGGQKPDIVATVQDVYDKIYQLVIPMQRTEDSTLANAGFENIKINGKTLVVDPHCGSTDAWVLNTNFLSLYVANGRNFSFEPFRKPTNQDARVAQIFWAGNLVCTQPRRHARIHSINVAL
jgi:hypothetical protein